MKKLLTLAFVCLAYATSFGQNVPQGIAYQAVAVKDGAYSVAGQNPQAIYWSNKDIKVRFTIFDTYPNGSSQYSELHTTTTDDYGVFNLIIGKGSGLSGDFTTIPWELGDAHLQVEIDFENTNKYVLSVIEKFWSVPFALHSRSADTLLGVYEETDPIFNGSVAKGITSNDTTYWNNKLDSYTETDPIFNSSVAKGITSNDTTYWNNKLDSYTETDPIFNGSVAKGITSSDTTYWNNKLDSYTETDPIFNSSVAKGITSSDTTYWNDKLDSYSETDPIFNSSVAKGITSTDTTYWNNKLDSYTETDPIFNSSVAKGITSSDTNYWNNKLDSYTETDPIFNSSIAKGITSTDTTYWNNKLDSYTETDPIFNGSVAKGITSADTAYWNSNLNIDHDIDSTNEVQSISMNNDTLSLSLGGGNVVLPSNWEKTNNTIVNKSDYVSIGANVTDSSAIVNITSTNAGVLMPRMTTSQREAIASPANGLLVFDTSTNSFWYYSSLWIELISNSSSGTGTSSSSNTLIYTTNGF